MHRQKTKDLFVWLFCCKSTPWDFPSKTLIQVCKKMCSILQSGITGVYFLCTKGEMCWVLKNVCHWHAGECHIMGLGRKWNPWIYTTSAYGNKQPNDQWIVSGSGTFVPTFPFLRLSLILYFDIVTRWFRNRSLWLGLVWTGLAIAIVFLVYEFVWIF